MSIKDFFKPDWEKVIIFFVLIIILGITFFLVTEVSIFDNMYIGTLFFLILVIVFGFLLGFPLIIATILDFLPTKQAFFILTILWLYFLSCLLTLLWPHFKYWVINETLAKKIAVGLLILMMLSGAYFVLYNLNTYYSTPPGGEQIENPPSSTKPLTISDNLTMERGDRESIGLGFYNKDADTARNVKFGISKCLNEDGESMEEKVPKVVSPLYDVPPSDRRAFRVIVEVDAEDFPLGDYVCTFSAFNSGEEGNIKPTEVEKENIYEQKKLFLEVK